MIINNHQLYVTDYYDYIYYLIKLTIIVVFSEKKKHTNTEHLTKRCRRCRSLYYDFVNSRDQNNTNHWHTTREQNKKKCKQKKQTKNCEAIPGIEQLHVLLD